jgi:hypothetical protein
VVHKTRDQAGQTPLIPSGIALRSEKCGTLIVVQAMNREPLLVKIEAYFGSNQSGRTRYENGLLACHQTITTSSEQM